MSDDASHADAPSHAHLVELEVRIAFQDETISALDEVVREFAARVERLESELGRMRKAMEGLPETGPADDPPPHY